MRRATIASLAVLLGTTAVLSASDKGARRAHEKKMTSLPAVTATAPAKHGRVPARLRDDAQIEGRWTLDRRDDGTLQLNLTYEERNNWGRSIDRADLVGLTDAQIDAPAATPVAFRIEREAGRFDLEGSFREGRGTGFFSFHPDRGFASTLRSLGIEGAERITDRELMTLAMAGASAATLRELIALDLGRLDVEQVIHLAIFDITPQYVRELRAAGVEGTNSAESVVELRIHRISAEYVAELASLGFEDLGRDDLLQMGIHGVSAEQVAQLAQMGYRGLSADELVQMAIFDISPEFIREMRGAGLGELSPQGLVDLRIHRITPAYIAELESLGYRGLSRDQLLQMGIHGVTADFIREVREAGFRDLSAETLVQMKIHGIDSEFVRVRRRG